MRMPRNFLTILATLIGAIPLLNADTLTLRDGNVLRGAFMGSDGNNIIFQMAGARQTYSRAVVASISLAAPQQATAKAPPRPPSPTSSFQAITIPAGTRLMVRLDQTLTTKQHKTGDRFTTTLESDLVVGGTPIAPRGTKVYGQLPKVQKSGRAVGKAVMVLQLTDIRINNELQPIMTEPYKQQSKGAGRATLRRSARGAAIGGMVDGGSGAGRGAAIGAGISMVTPGDTLQIPQGSLIEFRMSQPLTL